MKINKKKKEARKTASLKFVLPNMENEFRAFNKMFDAEKKKLEGMDKRTKEYKAQLEYVSDLFNQGSEMHMELENERMYSF